MALWNKENALDRSTGNTTYPSYPCEVMVKLFSSQYYSKLIQSPIHSSSKVIDVGCGAGNNLVFFLNKGLRAAGVEINEEMATIAQENLYQLLGQKTDIQVGSNHHIPFINEEFDYLISTAAIHYQKSKAEMHKALQEFKRVMKPGGVAFITTAGENHEVRKNAFRINEFEWEIRDYGFRTGSIMAFFDDLQALQQMCLEHFAEAEVGQYYEEYPTGTKLHFLYAVCKK